MTDGKKKDELSTQLFDAELAKVLDSVKDSEKKIGLIFQCKLPPRKFSVRSGVGKSKTLVSDSSRTDHGTRNATFVQFVKEIENIIGKDDMNAFETSGSVVAKVTVSQLKEIMKLVGNIKDIRANRRLKVGIEDKRTKAKKQEAN